MNSHAHAPNAGNPCRLRERERQRRGGRGRSHSRPDVREGSIALGFDAHAGVRCGLDMCHRTAGSDPGREGGSRGRTSRLDCAASCIATGPHTSVMESKASRTCMPPLPLRGFLRNAAVGHQPLSPQRTREGALWGGTVGAASCAGRTSRGAICSTRGASLALWSPVAYDPS